MRIFLFAFFAFFVSTALAKAPAGALNLYLLNAEARFERAGSQETVDRKPFNVAAGYSSLKYSVILEYSQFKEDTGNATSSLQRTHRDLMLWARYNAWSFGDRHLAAALYGGLGVGAYEEQVVTQFMATNRTDKSNPKFVSGASVGLEGMLPINRNFALVGALEGKMLVSNDFDPNPLWAGILRLGFALPL